MAQDKVLPLANQLALLGRALSAKWAPVADRAAARLAVLRSGAVAVATTVLALVVMLPPRVFGAVETTATATARYDVALVIALLALVAAVRAWMLAGRKMPRLRSRMRFLGRLPLLLAAPIAAAAIALNWFGS